mmetsp:Transcript_45002/g.104162  ORF Transcript_45002/g.104162 Transcript_45002/m.104162 type:complete len:1240 (+) Transcript_45002:103-3822(+)
MFTPSARQVFEPEEVARHNTPKSLWVVVDDQVYDVTQYCAEHPGGEAVLRHMGGKDATTAVRAAHKTTKPEERMRSMRIGCLAPRRSQRSTGQAATSLTVSSVQRKQRLVEAVAGPSDSGSDASGEHDVSKSDSVNSDSGLERVQLSDGSEGEGREALDSVLGGDPSSEDLLDEVKVDTFEELILSEDKVHSIQETWRIFCTVSGSQEAAGEAVYAALFEGAPSLQSLFTTPRAVQAMKFMAGLHSFVNNLPDPPQLKILVETLSFGHLHLDVTIPRVAMFRDAILDLLSVELNDRFLTSAYEGWKAMLNYIGGAIIYVKAHYAERIKILQDSWQSCVEKGKMDSSVVGSGDSQGNPMTQDADEKPEGKKSLFKKGKTMVVGAGHQQGNQHSNQDASSPKTLSMHQQQTVPNNFPDMFRFNAVVMGFSNRKWFNEVLACFHDLVTNVSNSIRFQEECDVLTLRISNVLAGAQGERAPIAYSEYKSCMLASLRSLLPKEWSTSHEVAWTWLWENVENFLKKYQQNTPVWEVALTKAMSHIDDSQRFNLRKDIYVRFFEDCPSGQNFFKQSNTYLHIIADKIIEMSLEMYKKPIQMVDDISSLGLRHVGYGIPTEHFGPFVSACVMVLQTYMSDATAVDAFRWSLALVSRMLVRTIREGSTIVMKAINTNNTKQLKKAIGCSPRGERAMWCLKVQVGTQSISPLSWAIQSGRLDAAGTIIGDLLTIRADRDSYYYGVDALFSRHPDIVQMLCQHAPKLLPVLYDGLIWRSRVTEQGTRRVNYFVKHLLVDADENFAQNFKHMADFADPKIVCHPVLELISDVVWSNCAYLTFLYGKSYYLFALLVFLASQSVLEHTGTDWDGTLESRSMVFGCRCFVYCCSLLGYLYTHLIKTCQGYRHGDTLQVWRVRLPAYLKNWQEVTSLMLTMSLIVMLSLEPILHCFGETPDDKLFSEDCEAAKDLDLAYSIASMTTVFLYFMLLIDLAAFSNRVSAYILLCSQMLPELFLFLLAMAGLVAAFASAGSVLTKKFDDFKHLHEAYLTLVRMSLDVYPEVGYEDMTEEPALYILALCFMIFASFFLLNMLIAQLTCSYSNIFVDMSGYARLSRIEVVVETMPLVPEHRWKRFLHSLKMDRKMEFNPGDVGLAGGIQVLEPAGAHATTVDMIRRYGGSTSPAKQWPEDGDEKDTDEVARFERMEKQVQKTLKKITRATSSKHGSRSGSQEGSVHSSSGSIASGGSEIGG